MTDKLKRAFARPQRELAALVEIDGVPLNDKFIEQIQILDGFSGEDEFRIGTAYSTRAEISLVDLGEELTLEKLVGKKCRIHIGMLRAYDFIESFGAKDGMNLRSREVLESFGVDADKVYEYVGLGEFTISEAYYDEPIYKLTAYDTLVNADKQYICKMQFPATLGAIFLDVCEYAGLEAVPTKFLHSDMKIEVKPQFYNMTCREVLAQIAELAGGYCKANIDGTISILGIEPDDINVCSDNISTFQRDPDKDKGVYIDTITIYQTGTLEKTKGEGTHPLYIVDNVFTQGQGEKYLPGLYAALAGKRFTPCTLTFNGNPLEKINGFTKIEYLGEPYTVFPMTRTLTYAGGLKEEWACPYLSNTLDESKKNTLVQSILEQGAKLLVLDDKIVMEVKSMKEYGDGKLEEYKTERVQTDREIYNRITQSTTYEKNGERITITEHMSSIDQTLTSITAEVTGAQGTARRALTEARVATSVASRAENKASSVEQTANNLIVKFFDGTGTRGTNFTLDNDGFKIDYGGGSHFTANRNGINLTGFIDNPGVHVSHYSVDLRSSSYGSTMMSIYADNSGGVIDSKRKIEIYAPGGVYINGKRVRTE